MLKKSEKPMIKFRTENHSYFNRKVSNYYTEKRIFKIGKIDFFLCEYNNPVKIKFITINYITNE
jgi:hypothetical protein